MKGGDDVRASGLNVSHHVRWAGTMVITVGALVLLLLAMGHWWPAGTNWYLTAALAGVVLSVAALVWAISALHTIGYRRHWSWWLLLWPVVAAIGVAGAVYVAPPEFSDARPEFDAMAQHLLDRGNQASLDDLRIGRFEVRRAYVMSGNVYFVDARRSMFALNQGWVYSPDGPPGLWHGDPESIGGHWYRYQRSLNR